MSKRETKTTALGGLSFAGKTTEDKVKFRTRGVSTRYDELVAQVGGLPEPKGEGKDPVLAFAMPKDAKRPNVHNSLFSLLKRRFPDRTFRIRFTTDDHVTVARVAERAPRAARKARAPGKARKAA